MRELDRRIRDVETYAELAHKRVARGVEVAGLRKIRAEMRAARILPLQRGLRNHLRRLDLRAQIQPVRPGHIEGAAIFADAGREKFTFDLAEPAGRPSQRSLVAYDADVVPHQVEQGLAQAIEVAHLALAGHLGARAFRLNRVFIRGAEVESARKIARHRLARDAAEHGRVGDAVATEAVGAVHAAGILSPDINALLL